MEYDEEGMMKEENVGKEDWLWKLIHGRDINTSPRNNMSLGGRRKNVY